VHQGMGTLFLGDRVDVLESQSAVI
jgi:hypothetical protein